MNPKRLQDIGLTPGETKVYLALLSLGSSKTGLLAAKAGVSSSKVYKILDRLIQKGLVGYVLQGKIKYFTALESNRVLDYVNKEEQEFQQKKKLLQKLLPQLELERKLSGKKTQAVIYDGFKACTNFFRSIIDELNSGETYYVIGAGYGSTPALRPFFHQHHQRRAEKGIKLKMLANYDVKKNLEKNTLQQAEIRFLPQYLITNMEIVFYRNKSFIVLWTKFPVGFLLENEEATKGFRAYFNTFWKMAGK